MTSEIYISPFFCIIKHYYVRLSSPQVPTFSISPALPYVQHQGGLGHRNDLNAYSSFLIQPEIHFAVGTSIKSLPQHTFVAYNGFCHAKINMHYNTIL